MGKTSLHATGVYFQNQGVLILGPSGSGKTSLALELISQGAQLIADDVVWVWAQDDVVYAQAHNTTCGMIEVRGIGIVQGLEYVSTCRIDYVVQLCNDKSERIPADFGTMDIAGIAVPVFYANQNIKYLPTFVKIAGKIISNELSLLKVT